VAFATPLEVATVRSMFNANRELLYKVVTRLAELVDAPSGEPMEQRSIPLVERRLTRIRAVGMPSTKRS
jgi:hypothetical protein